MTTEEIIKDLETCLDGWRCYDWKPVISPASLMEAKNELGELVTLRAQNEALREVAKVANNALHVLASIDNHYDSDCALAKTLATAREKGALL